MAECILVGNGSENNTSGESYEVGEVDTGGVWVDNSPVYRLIINNINTQTFTADLSNYITGSIDAFINADACFYNSSTNQMFMLSTQNNNNTYAIYTKNTNTLTFTSNVSGFVILWVAAEYTKEVSS